MESERRRHPRYPFMAAAEVTDSESGTLLEARTSDLSSDGCYLDTINPLPQQTIIKIQIDYEGEVFVAKGVVVHLQPSMGMGVTFIALETGCADILKGWLRNAATQ
jgi:hypothetical protein